MIARRLVEATGADYSQWRVLTSTMLKAQLRTAKALQTTSTEERGRKLPWGMLVMYGLFGVYMSITAGLVPGAFMSGTVVLLMICIMIATSILVDFQSIVVSADDYEVLGHQPVSSRTYFVVKVTSVLVYTGTIGGLMGGFAAIPYLVKYGPLVAAAWIAALAGVIVWTTLAMVYLYAAMLHLIPQRRLRRALSYLQLIAGFGIFAPLFLMMYTDWLPTTAVDPPIQFLVLPSTWFASLLPLAEGNWSASILLSVAAAFGSIVVLVRYVGVRLSLSYAERLGAIVSGSTAPRRPRVTGGRARAWMSPELHAVATLVRGQFRDDMNFRLGVLSILPITVFYVFMGLRDGTLPDPFVELGFGASDLFLIHLAALVLPLILMENLFRSESYRAAWVFFAAPVDRARLVANAGNCVTVFFLVPYLIVLAGVLAWVFGHIWHAVTHALVLGLMAHVLTHMTLLAAPRLPFAMPPRTGVRIGSVMGVMLVGMVGVGLLPLFLWIAYAQPLNTVVAIAALTVAALLMPRFVTRRVRDRVGELEFTG